VLLEVLLQLLGGEVHAIAHLLVVGVVLLGGGQHLAQVIDWPLDRLGFAIFWALNHDHGADNPTGSGDVEKHGLFGNRSGQNRRCGQHPLELEEGLVCLVSPLEAGGLLHQLVQWEGLLAQPTDEPAERC
jgi:hypothetical protein